MRVEELKIILSLDQSLSDIGICSWDISSDKIDCFNYAPREKGVKRLEEIYNYLKNLLLRIRPTLVIMEDYAFSAKGHTFSLGELGGLIKLLTYQWRIRCIQLPIGTWKKHLSGNGAIKKDMVLKETYKQFGKDFNNDNIADAYCMLEAFRTFYYDHMGLKHERKDWQVAAIQKWGKNKSLLEMYNDADGLVKN